MSGFLSDDESYPCRVVVNYEEQYSLWPLDREIPDGWRDSGFGMCRSPISGTVRCRERRRPPR